MTKNAKVNLKDVVKLLLGLLVVLVAAVVMFVAGLYMLVPAIDLSKQLHDTFRTEGTR